MGADQRHDLPRRRQESHRIDQPQNPQQDEPCEPIGRTAVRRGLRGIARMHADTSKQTAGPIQF